MRDREVRLRTRMRRDVECGAAGLRATMCVCVLVMVESESLVGCLPAWVWMMFVSNDRARMDEMNERRRRRRRRRRGGKGEKRAS
jgi:hypothetical protein